jgi:hypothetical protein
MKLIYLVGEPGVGKTTTMRALTDQWALLGVQEYPFAHTLFGRADTGVVDAVELGRYRDTGYGGTDALGMSVIERVVPWLRTGPRPALLLGEGARLGNRRLLFAAADAGYAVHLCHLDGPDIAAARRRSRGSTQNDSWVRGRATAARNLHHLLSTSELAAEVGIRCHRIDPHGTGERVASRVLEATS